MGPGEHPVVALPELCALLQDQRRNRALREEILRSVVRLGPVAESQEWTLDYLNQLEEHSDLRKEARAARAEINAGR